MGAKWRVLMCLRTLHDLVQQPERGRFSSSSRFKQRIAELKFLQESIDSGKILVYVPPVLLAFIHFAIRSEYELEEATVCLQKLLGFVVCNLDIDYDSILKKANASTHNLGDADLYDVICLACAEALNADAFITESVVDFRKIVDSNYREFPDFNVRIMNVKEFIQDRTRAETQYVTDKNAIYVFTPQLTEIKLPRGATPIDFAYKIHTKLGDRCVKALVKGVEVSLDHPLQDGDIVEIIKGQADCLNSTWLDFAITAEAKRSIHRGIKRITTANGWEAIKQAFENNIRIYRKSLEDVASGMNCSTDDIAFQIGTGVLSIEELKELVNQYATKQVISEPRKPLLGTGERGWSLASCCNPLPGDSIIGVAGSGHRPLRIHISNCPTVAKIGSENLWSVSWNSERHTIHLQIIIKNTSDAIRAILNRLAEYSISADFRGFYMMDNETAKSLSPLITFPESV